jgi:hypothetical protein
MNIAPRGVFAELDMKMRMYAAQDLARIEARIEGADAAVILDAGAFPPMHIVVTGGKLDIGASLKAHATVRTMPSGAIECSIEPAAGTR